MAVLPIDLQVLFSKSTEHSENIARHSNAAQLGQLNSFEKIHKESVQINERIKETDEYAQDFTKVNPDAEKKPEQYTSSSSGKEKKEDGKEYKPALKEDGKGNIIDIVE
ncbi:MAG: hypothetical protein ACP5QT_03235 [Brevinematia bacterium]